MTKQTNGAAEADKTEKLVEVRLLRNYVPINAEYSTTPDDGHTTKIYTKVLAGEVVSLPRSEAKRVLDLKIAEITADLV